MNASEIGSIVSDETKCTTLADQPVLLAEDRSITADTLLTLTLIPNETIPAVVRLSNREVFLKTLIKKSLLS